MQNIINALKQIEQMSDCGSDFLAVIRMKEIATNTLKEIQENEDKDKLRRDKLSSYLSLTLDGVLPEKAAKQLKLI